jgi:hypothetical protein
VTENVARLEQLKTRVINLNLRLAQIAKLDSQTLGNAEATADWLALKEPLIDQLENTLDELEQAPIR